MQGAEVNFAQINSDGSSGDEDSALDDSDSEFHLENSALALACDALVVAARQQAEADDEMEAASTDGGSFVAPSVTTRQQFQDYQRQQLNPIMPSQTRPIGAGVEPADQESPVKAFKSKRQVYAGKPITRAIIQGGKRKFPCTYEGCGKVFSTSGHMTRHYRIHSGQKTFKCLIPDCTSYFSRHDNMKQHYRSHLKKLESGRANPGARATTSIKKTSSSSNSTTASPSKDLLASWKVDPADGGAVQHPGLDPDHHESIRNQSVASAAEQHYTNPHTHSSTISRAPRMAVVECPVCGTTGFDSDQGIERHLWDVHPNISRFLSQGSAQLA